MTLNKVTFLKTLSSYQLTDACWVAFSGGIDSCVLLHLLASVRDEFSFDLKAIHIDHGLQADSADWADQCVHFASDLSIDCVVHSLALKPKQGESVEALAREKRYAVFSNTLACDDMLLMAHHQNDQAETVLLQLLRGAGVAGLAAMPKVGRTHGVQVVRPLLDFKREDIVAYASENQIQWIEDPSNEDLNFDRNYLRHLVMPFFDHWPAYSKTLSRSAEHCAQANDLLNEYAQIDLEQIIGELPQIILIDRLCVLSEQRQINVLRYWLRNEASVLIDNQHLQRLLQEVIAARADAKPEVILGNVQIRRYRNQLWILNFPLPVVPDDSVIIEWKAGETHCDLPDELGTLEWVNGAELFQEKTISIKWRQAAIRCQPIGRVGSRNIKKIAQEAAIPPWIRDRMPLIFANGELIAIADYCVCELSTSEGLPVQFKWQCSALPRI